MEFHIRIAKISGNPIFVAVSESMLAWLREYHTHMLIWTGKEKYTLVEHEEIVDKLAVKDADGAEAAMLNHGAFARALYEIAFSRGALFVFTRILSESRFPLFGMRFNFQECSL